MFRTAATALIFSTMFGAARAMAADTPIADQAVAVVSTATVALQPLPIARPQTAIRRTRSLVLPSLYVSLSALQAYDVYSTLTAMRHGASEANPVMRGVVGNPTAFVAMKAGVTGVSIYASERLWRQNRKKSAVLLMVASNGLMAYVAAHNASVLRAVR